MEKRNKEVIFTIGIYIILFEIVYITISIFLESYLGGLNAPYESWMAREWIGLFYIVMLFLAIIIVILLVILIVIKGSYKLKPKNSKIVSAIIITAFTMFISYFPIVINTKNIILEIKKINLRKEIPDFEYCLDCNLGYGAFSANVGLSGTYRVNKSLRIYSIDTNIQLNKTLINKLYGIKDIHDSIIIAAKYTLINGSDEGPILTASIINDTIYYGYIDSNANVVFPNELDYGGWFEGGSAKVVKNHKFSIIDTKGNFLISPIYDCIKEYRNGLAIFYIGPKEGCFNNGKFGIVNKNNDTLVKPNDMITVSFLSNNVYVVYNNFSRTIKLYNFKGELLRDKNDSYCSEFTNGKAFIRNDSLELGGMLVDTNANVILKSHRKDKNELYELYVKNQIIKNYQIIKYDSLNRKFIFLNKPQKREIPLKKFSYYSISERTEFSYYPTYKAIHRKDYIAYESYFKSLRVYNIDSAQIDIRNDSLDFRLMFYFKNDSLKYSENNERKY